MHCLSDEEFGALIENDLAPERRAHVAECAACAETWAKLEHADWSLRSAPPRRRSARPFIAAAIAAAAVIGAVAWAVTRPEPARSIQPAPTAKKTDKIEEPKQPEPKQPEFGKPEEPPKHPDVKQPDPQPMPVNPDPKKPDEPPGITDKPPKKPAEKPVETKKEPEKPTPEETLALDSFDKMMRRAGREEAAREAAFIGLRQVRGPFVMQRMIDSYDKETSPRAKIAIAQGLGDYRSSDKALKSLAGWLSHDGRQGDLDKTILEAMTEFDADDLKAYAKKVSALMAAGDTNVARAAVGFAIVTKDTSCIEMLVDQMSVHQLQMRAYIGTDDDGGLDSPAVQQMLDKHLRGTLTISDARVTRYVQVMPTMNAAMQRVTGQTFKNAKAWREWWDKNKKSWK